MLRKPDMELRDQSRTRKTDAIEPLKAKKARKERPTKLETMFKLAMGPSDIFQI